MSSIWLHVKKTNISNIAVDNPVNQKVATLMLEKLGCRCDVVANGVDAVEAIKNIPYDNVFMDCQME